MDLKNKVVVITGASKGLGKEISRLLASEGSKLALLSRSKTEPIHEYCKTYICDITKNDEVSKTIDKIKDDFGRVDILINNAGIWAEGNLEQHSFEQIKKVVDVVTLGTIYTSKCVVPIMKSQKFGHILNIVSVAGVETPGSMGPYSPYTSAKYAITGFTKALSEELRKSNIKVSGIFPGGMNTELFKSAGFDYTDHEDWMMDKKDVAKIIVFMLKQPDDVLIDHVVVRKFK